VAKKKETQKRAPRKTPNLDEVIAVSIELLLQHGEGGFRIEDVIERTGISKSSLYLHFGDRDGLVGAAYVEQFTTDTNRNITQALLAFEDVKTQEQLETLLPAFVQNLAQVSHTVRWNRLDVLSAARYRPEFMSRIVEAQTRLNSALAEALSAQQKLGNVRSDMSAREMAVLIQGVSFGRIFRDLDSKMDRDNLSDWSELAAAVYKVVLPPKRG
jgi:AcrR family transcriptional regulator